jgi:membrane protein
MSTLTTWVTDRLDRWQRRAAPFRFLMAVLRKFADDQAGNLASLLAYYAFLAVFPLLLVLVTVLGIVLHDDPSAQQRILHSALIDFPIIGSQLRSNVQSLGRSGVGLAIGLIGTLIGARGLTLSVQRAFNTAWAVPFTRRPSFIGRQLRSLVLLGVIALAITVTGALSGIASVGGLRGSLVTTAALLVSAALNAGFFVLGFRVATAKEIPLHNFVRAAVVAALGWQILLTAGSYLIAHELRHAEEVYGLFGLVLGLIAWLHVQAQLTLLVLEADIVRAQGLWPRAINSDYPVELGDCRAHTAYAKAQQRRPDVVITVSCPVGRAEEAARSTAVTTAVTSAVSPADLSAGSDKVAQGNAQRGKAQNSQGHDTGLSGCADSHL